MRATCIAASTFVDPRDEIQREVEPRSAAARHDEALFGAVTTRRAMRVHAHLRISAAP
jgi:hypothetical protein